MVERQLRGEVVVGPAVRGEAYAHFIRAERCADHADWSGANAHYAAAHSLASTDAYLVARWARAKQASGQPSEALELLDRAEAELGPAPWLALARAQLALDRGEPRNALDLSRALLHEAPHFEANVLFYVELQTDFGPPGDSLRVLLELMEHHPAPSRQAWRQLLYLAAIAGERELLVRSIENLGRGSEDLFLPTDIDALDALPPPRRQLLCDVLHRRAPAWNSQIECR